WVSGRRGERPRGAGTLHRSREGWRRPPGRRGVRRGGPGRRRRPESRPGRGRGPRGGGPGGRGHSGDATAGTRRVSSRDPKGTAREKKVPRRCVQSEVEIHSPSATSGSDSVAVILDEGRARRNNRLRASRGDRGRRAL